MQTSTEDRERAEVMQETFKGFLRNPTLTERELERARERQDALQGYEKDQAWETERAKNEAIRRKETA